ncbi:MAG: hypothetical protein IH631_09770, partial [Candidatus Thorarchaeota archaeon]|nr:hypothetical protein [Candidatus Thorarchaeota archaeon]
DPDEYNNTLSFAQELQRYVNVTIVPVEEIMGKYVQYPYIVLVGRPDPESDTVAGLTYSLLADTGTVLEAMMEPDSHEIATRYGYWANPQTIVILSEAYSTDVFTVLQILRWRNVTVLPDYVLIEYQTQIANDMAAYTYTFNVNEIDVLKATDMILSITLGGLALPRLLIHRYDATTSPYLLTSDNGLAEGEVSLDKYLEITLTFTGTTVGTLQSALLQIYYRPLELDFDGDACIGLGDLNESTLCLYWYDEQSASWMRLSEDLDWVLDIGLNTTDVQLYGESYAGFIWVRVTHLSFFALAGELIVNEVTYPDLMLTIVLLCGGGLFALVFTYRWMKKPEKEKQKK